MFYFSLFYNGLDHAYKNYFNPPNKTVNSYNGYSNKLLRWSEFKIFPLCYEDRTNEGTTNRRARHKYIIYSICVSAGSVSLFVLYCIQKMPRSITSPVKGQGVKIVCQLYNEL